MRTNPQDMKWWRYEIRVVAAGMKKICLRDTCKVEHGRTEAGGKKNGTKYTSWDFKLNKIGTYQKGNK